MDEEAESTESIHRKIFNLEMEKEDLIKRTNRIEEKIIHLKSGKYFDKYFIQPLNT